MDARVRDIIERASSGIPATEDECVHLMGFPEDSEESGEVIAAAGGHIRSRDGNMCSIGVQIGVITGPCIADCGFCGFAIGTTKADEYVMPQDVLRDYLREATRYGDVESVSLMTIHNFDFDDLLDAVRTARGTLPDDVKICVNTGDVTAEELRELRSAGVVRAYHALRIDEGEDTRLNPLDRYGTIRRMRDAGIEPVSCVEPIGPEHSPKEIARRFFEARGYGCSHCSAARRLDVPGTRLFGSGEISEMRIAQIRSALLLSTVSDGFYGGYYGGFNKDFAEYAGSPKDNADYSEKGRGNTLEAVRRRLFDAGYGWISAGDGRRIRLDEDHLERTGSLRSEPSHHPLVHGPSAASQRPNPDEHPATIR